MSKERPINEDSDEDAEFKRTGVFKVDLDCSITITYEDMLKDLVNKTEGKKIDIKPPEAHEKN